MEHSVSRYLCVLYTTRTSSLKHVLVNAKDNNNIDFSFRLFIITCGCFFFFFNLFFVCQ